MQGGLLERKASTPRTAPPGRGPAGGGRGRIGTRGFTAIDLLTAVTIAAILIGAAMPVLLGAIQRSRLDAAARQLVSEIRKAQSLAVTRSGVFGFHWGGDPNITGLLNSQYRIERDATGGCAWPAASASMADPNPDVITDWFDLSGPFPGVTITSVRDSTNIMVGGVIFDSIGASVNTCAAVTFPLTMTLMDDAGATRTIEVRSAGSVRAQ
ncbi:MAG: Tfp pilus assembly protein FimT/FimU [Candidatus Methylomirabilales bacterium]